ncbi:YdcF family protein [Mangrovibrevibacter kandeliae]|uniref:YdcF family protein n=1 Tax=Mangrovibrevibacter kandeliae TaxID=2968473 RepID=UPI0021186993|nr:YdcF family protein [Aurantimonas sp. CSK15Z-1]
MFFLLSKLAWFVLQPLVALLLLAACGWGLRRLGLPALGGIALGLSVVGLLLVLFSPLGLLMMNGLEQRFPKPELPERIDGIVVLGGSFDTRVARARGGDELNEAADRVTQAAALALRYPDAKLLFTGGVAAVLEDDIPEVDAAKTFFTSLGIPQERILLEGKARNTAENAVYSKPLANPQPGETWLLVTSAYHMPRAVGCFRSAGFDVLPYPVDFRTPSGPALWRPSSLVLRNAEKVDFALREYLGLFAYWMSGRIDSLFPRPARL